jgi:hypothetical protein
MHKNVSDRQYHISAQCSSGLWNLHLKFNSRPCYSIFFINCVHDSQELAHYHVFYWHTIFIIKSYAIVHGRTLLLGSNGVWDTWWQTTIPCTTMSNNVGLNRVGYWNCLTVNIEERCQSKLFNKFVVDSH